MLMRALMLVRALMLEALERRWLEDILRSREMCTGWWCSS
jgi:hypothetical protein